MIVTAPSVFESDTVPASNILVVDANNTTEVIVAFDRSVTLNSSPTSLQFLISGNPAVSAVATAADVVRLTFHDNVGPAEPWQNIEGSWVTPTVAPSSGTTQS